MGGKAGRNHAVKIPARPYLGLSEKDKTDLNDLISDFLEEKPVLTPLQRIFAACERFYIYEFALDVLGRSQKWLLHKN